MCEGAHAAWCCEPHTKVRWCVWVCMVLTLVHNDLINKALLYMHCCCICVRLQHIMPIN